MKVAKPDEATFAKGMPMAEASERPFPKESPWDYRGGNVFVVRYGISRGRTK